jgi:hypothetical protein
MKLYGGTISVDVLCKILGNECVKSDHYNISFIDWVNPKLTGLINTAPAGNSSPSVSLKICSKASTKPPPAESPAMTICSGLTGLCFAPGGGRVR